MCTAPSIYYFLPETLENIILEIDRDRDNGSRSDVKYSTENFLKTSYIGQRIIQMHGMVYQVVEVKVNEIEHVLIRV